MTDTNYIIYNTRNFRNIKTHKEWKTTNDGQEWICNEKIALEGPLHTVLDDDFKISWDPVFVPNTHPTEDNPTGIRAATREEEEIWNTNNKDQYNTYKSVNRYKLRNELSKIKNTNVAWRIAFKRFPNEQTEIYDKRDEERNEEWIKHNKQH